MNQYRGRLGWLVICGICVMGCSSSKPPENAPPTSGNMASPPATAPAVSTPNSTATPPPAVTPPTANMATPATPPVVALADKDTTHVLTQDEPYYDGSPGASTTPSGTLKSGSKVLLMVPGSPYSEVETQTGKTVYTVTAGLKPVGK